MEAYCLFCLTQRCDAIAAQLERSEGVRAISPRVIQRKWIKGKPFEEAHPYLPGYVFVYTSRDVAELFHTEGVIRVLDDGPLTGNDLAFAMMLYEKDGVIGSVKVRSVGDRLTLASGPMKGYEGQIVRVDRHQTRLQLKFDFDGLARCVWVGYDVVE